jgi:hypothetical protein
MHRLASTLWEIARSMACLRRVGKSNLIDTGKEYAVAAWAEDKLSQRGPRPQIRTPLNQNQHRHTADQYTETNHQHEKRKKLSIAVIASGCFGVASRVEEIASLA